MRVPFAADVPAPLRRLAKAMLPPVLHGRIAADLQHFAHRQYRGHAAFARSQAALSVLRGKHCGETCMVIGNGPSMRGEDFGKFAGIPTFCLNRGYLMWREQRRTPSYLVAVNQLVIEQFHSELAAAGCPVFVPWQHHTWFAATDQAIFVEERYHHRFFTDVTAGLFVGATVTFAAMQLAYHMGFKRVILIGVDHRFKEQGKAHAEVLQKGDDANHFDPNYFGNGVRWNLPDLDQSEVSYRMAKKAFEADNREIIDATRNGALEVFLKMPLAEALARGKKS